MSTHAHHRSAFTLVEALVALSLLAMAGTALLMGTVASLQTTHLSQDQTVALGMADQLMDEILGLAYLPESGNPYATPIQPSASQVSGVSRALFTAIGDFNGYRCQPPTDPWGILLGTDDGQGGARPAAFQSSAGMFANWRQEVSVCYVSGSDLTTALTSGTSDYRAVTVTINYVDPQSGQTRPLAKLRRVVTYVPALP